VGEGGDERVVGHAGELHPRVCAALDLPARTSVMEFDVDALPPAPVPVGPRISAFPPVFLDLAFVVPDEVTAAHVESLVRGGAGELFESVRLFDVYSGPPVPAGSRSLAYSLVLRAPDRTLTADDVARVREGIVAVVGMRGITLRSGD
jgi:phenylalanyl-tRNA synthetase beta chain